MEWAAKPLLPPDPHCRTWQQHSRTRDTKFAGVFLSTVGSEEQDGLQGLPSLAWGQRQWSQISKVPWSFRVKPDSNLSCTYTLHPQTLRHIGTYPLPHLILRIAHKAVETTFVCFLSYSNTMKSLGICNVRYPISISNVQNTAMSIYCGSVWFV